MIECAAMKTFLLASLLGLSLATTTAQSPSGPPLAVTVLSSHPDMVSGGDALVAVTAPSSDIQVTLNGADVTSKFHLDWERHAIVGLVPGLRDGKNTIVAKAGKSSVSLVVTNHPVTGPILSGEHIKPYVCMTQESGLGAPLDADCIAATKLDHFYRAKDGTFKPYPGAESAPADMSETTTSEGKTVPYIVRVESGTINRAIYRIAMLE